MSIYVLQSGEAQLECNMDYQPGGDIECVVRGVEEKCVEEAVKRVGSNYVRAEGFRLYVSTLVFKGGRTPGELIKEIALLLKYCPSLS
ncbi:MAG: hypothetical protein ABWK05_03590 [Pyrobaculum sp.]